MSKTILEALKSLDVNDDLHWTDEGLPRLDAVGSFLGKMPTRQQITSVAPAFNRAEARQSSVAAVAEAQTGDAPALPSTVDLTPPSAPPVIPEFPKNEVSAEEARKAKLADIHARRGKNVEEIRRLQNENAQFDKEIANLTTDGGKVTPHSHTVREVLDRARLEREAKAKLIAEVRASGVNLDELKKLTSPAPVDAIRMTKRPAPVVPAHLR